MIPFTVHSPLHFPTLWSMHVRIPSGCVLVIHYSNKLDVNSTVPIVQVKTSTSSSCCVVTGITTSTFVRFFDRPLLTLPVPLALNFVIGTSLSSIPFPASLVQLLVASANRGTRSSGESFAMVGLELLRSRFFDGLQSPPV